MDLIAEDQLQMDSITQEKSNAIEVDISGNVSVASAESNGSYIMKMVHKKHVNKGLTEHEERQ